MEENKNNSKINLSVIIPAHNEEKIISQTVEGLKDELKKLNLEYEIIIINDASTDNTKEVIEKIPGVKFIHHQTNKGYGASLKTGIRNAQFNNLLFFDADGQHKTEYIAEMIKYAGDFDLISGARIGYKGPLVRQPGKKLLRWLAKYLSKQDIPDLNCGLRIVKRDKINKFIHLLCDGFSFSTTTLLTFANEELSIKYVPVTINKREGKSKVRPRHALDTLIFILQTILLTSPLRVFLPITGLLILLTIISSINDIIQSYHTILHISTSTLFLAISSVLIFFFGLLTDQMVAIRKDLKNDHEQK
jgi:glycosyltransferase involved in cell wall biosynthesis